MFKFFMQLSSYSLSPPSSSPPSPQPSEFVSDNTERRRSMTAHVTTTTKTTEDPLETTASTASAPLARGRPAALSVSVRSSRQVSTSPNTQNSPEAMIRHLERRIARRMGEGRKRHEQIIQLRSVLSKMRPSSTSPWPLPVELESALVPFPLDHLAVQEDVVAFVGNLTMKYEAQIADLDAMLERQSKEITRLQQDLHGLRLRTRSYDAMVACGAPIAEYTQHIDACRQTVMKTES